MMRSVRPHCRMQGSMLPFPRDALTAASWQWAAVRRAAGGPRALPLRGRQHGARGLVRARRLERGPSGYPQQLRRTGALDVIGKLLVLGARPAADTSRGDVAGDGGGGGARRGTAESAPASESVVLVPAESWCEVARSDSGEPDGAAATGD
eukprot:5952023-Pleurochrysis_carterae.AAC.1